MARILVAYATKKGSTAEIAQAIAKELQAAGHSADAVDNLERDASGGAGRGGRHARATGGSGAPGAAGRGRRHRRACGNLVS